MTKLERLDALLRQGEVGGILGHGLSCTVGKHIACSASS